MANNNRIFYAIQAVGFAPHGSNADVSGVNVPSGFMVAHGLQSVQVQTTFNLEQVFEIGQLEIYENIEGIPDIQVTAEKVLDGYPLLYHLATQDASSPTLVGRSNNRAFVAMNIYPDTNDNASGIPIQAVGMSGMYINSLTYTLNVDGNSTESVTLVGNNKTWVASGYPTFRPNFDGTDEPLAINGSGGTQRREDVLMGESEDSSIWPTNIPGISSSGTNKEDGDSFLAHIQTVTISTDLGRSDLFELGRRGPYHRFVNFPVEVTTDIVVTSSEGDLVNALADPPGGTNLTNETIRVQMREGARFDCGDRNKLSQVTYGGADAGAGGGGGGNAQVTYSFSNFNRLTVTHPEDPASL